MYAAPSSDDFYVADLAENLEAKHLRTPIPASQYTQAIAFSQAKNTPWRPPLR
jgi:hypothetical protein